MRTVLVFVGSKTGVGAVHALQQCVAAGFILADDTDEILALAAASYPGG
jgi:hypothetical protein